MAGGGKEWWDPRGEEFDNRNKTKQQQTTGFVFSSFLQRIKTDDYRPDPPGIATCPLPIRFFLL